MEDDAIVKQGWLRKSPPAGVMKAWKKRYFCFKKKTAHGAARMEYYAETNKAARGVIDLRTCTAVEEGTHEPEKSRYNFRLVTQGRIYTLQAPSYSEMKEWIDAVCEELFKPEEPRAQPATLPSKTTAPAMAARENLPIPTQEAPRRTSISVKRQPVVPPGPRCKPYHPQPLGEFPWLYGKISRHATESLLADYGLQNGLFLVRESGSHSGAYAISVCHNGKVIHHLVRSLPNGTFQLNDNECGDCTSLDEVIDFLESPKGPPLNWRYELKVCPKTYDEMQLSQQNSAPPSENPPLPPRVDPAIPSSARSFSATLATKNTTQAFTLQEGEACTIRISDSTLAVCNATGAVVYAWPIVTIFDFGIDQHLGTFYLRSNDDYCSGDFHFKSANSFDMMAVLRQSLPAVSSARQQSLRTPSNIDRQQPTFQSVREKPAIAKKPPPLVPRGAGSKTTLPKNAGLAALAENPSGDYEQPMDAIDLMRPDTSKPMPPPISGPKPTGGALSKDALKQNLNSVMLNQADALRTGKPAIPLRKPDVHVDADANVDGTLKSKRTSVADIGVAIPGVGAADITKALSTLKRTQPEAISEEEQEPTPSPAKSVMTPTAPAQQIQDPAQQKTGTLRPQLQPQLAMDAEEMPEQYLAGCDFQPDPSAVDRLPFEEGDVILILKKPNPNWWLGRLGNKEGWVPASYMDPMDQDPGMNQGVSDDDDIVAKALAAVHNADATLQRLDSTSMSNLSGNDRARSKGPVNVAPATRTRGPHASVAPQSLQASARKETPPQFSNEDTYQDMSDARPVVMETSRYECMELRRDVEYVLSPNTPHRRSQQRPSQPTSQQGELHQDLYVDLS
eukprot:m.30916 g.30916  ORF g.30916 m.30916 type:complete len:847 (-) comp10653_c0_seq1:292-2832(-)